MKRIPPTVTEIRLFSKVETKEQIEPPVPVHRYNGPKKPDMPEAWCERRVPPLKLLTSQAVSLFRAHDIDHHFLQEIVDNASCTPAEYNGFNVALARNHGHSVKPATTAIYTPLIDMTPSDPDTIMSAMIEDQRLTNACGQTITVFTNDQQLYRVAVNVTWVYPRLFTNFVPRLGGMHFLMSFVGAVGTLMSNSGLTEIMQTTFGGVPKMLSGKKFPENVRALRMVVEELLRSIVTGTVKDKQNNKTTTTHKEEAPGRITSDASYRQKIKEALQNYIDPLATDTHPPWLLNVVKGLHATDKVNADESIKIGREQMTEFESGWPTSFNKILTKNVTMMTSAKKSIKLDGKPVYDTELIYTRELFVFNSIETLITQMSSPTNFLQCRHHCLMRVVLCVLNRRQS